MQIIMMILRRFIFVILLPIWMILWLCTIPIVYIVGVIVWIFTGTFVDSICLEVTNQTFDYLHKLTEYDDNRE